MYGEYIIVIIRLLVANSLNLTKVSKQLKTYLLATRGFPTLFKL